MQATIDRDIPLAEELIGWSIPPEWFIKVGAVNHFQKMLIDDSSFRFWSPRAIGLESEQSMVGHIGFHTRPNPQYLNEYVGSGIEMGYTVFADCRRRGYATEAIIALTGWANHDHGVETFVISVGVDNHPSLALAQKFGFTKVGEHQDEDDGPEIVLSLRGVALSVALGQ
ncbi:MAG: GNAT family N-acetyltransferase [Chloroflexi bacterium]|nr:GNAT family N-acetyltransferase [Chloroflexota bacterium]